VLTYQRWGYDSITDSNILKKFATALKNVLEREYPKIKVSNIQKNKWGFLMLELVVEKVEGKNLFTEISSADESQIELRVQLQMVNRMFTLAKLSLWREEQTGEVKERTFDEVIGYAKEIIVLADRLTNLSEEEHQQIQSAYVTLACMLYEKHEMKFEQKTAGMEDLRQMIVAQKCFAKVLPFAKEQYTFDEIDKSMKYLFVLMNLRAFDENSDYIEEIEPSMRGFDYKREFYKIVFELYVKTRSFFKTEQRYDGYNRAIISELIKIKCDLGDFNGVDVYLEEYISTGSNDAERYYDYIEKKRRSCKSSCRN